MNFSLEWTANYFSNYSTECANYELTRGFQGFLMDMTMTIIYSIRDSDSKSVSEDLSLI